jgi:uncharacterized damage-inducible protein DinB
MATATDAYAASRATFEIVYTDLIGFLRQLDDACVRWVPPAPETNSISGMVRHLLSTTARWIARATGDPLPPANREAELHATDSVAELIAATERALEELRRSFERLQQVDPAELRRFTMITRPGEREESVGWCVEHALVHAGEHWGHIQLTAQMHAAQG